MAFITQKWALRYVVVLVLQNFAKIFSQETTPQVLVLVFLCQEGNSIAFFDQKLSPRMQVASTYTREMFSIIEVVQKRQQYLLGQKFLIITDQQPLKALTNEAIQTHEQKHCLSKLIGFDIEILYHLGKLTSTVDVLSRVPTMIGLTLAVTKKALINKLRQLNKTMQSCLT